MADAISSTLGFGTLTGGTSAVPVAVVADLGAIAIGIVNRETTNYAHIKPSNAAYKGPFIPVGPGEEVIFCGGNSPGFLVPGALKGFADASLAGSGSASTTCVLSVRTYKGN